MYETLTKKICKILGINKPLRPDEKMFIATWKEEYKMKDEVVLEAAERAKKKGGKAVSFNYMNGILKNWHSNNATTFSEILKLDAEFKNKKKQESEESQNEESPNFKMKIKLLSDTAKVPTYGITGSAGADLYADIPEPIYIAPGKTEMISTGIAIEIPEGYVGLLCARSGLATKRDIAPANKTGIIDAQYNGPVIFAAHNHSIFDKETMDSDEYAKDHTIYPGDRIAQLVIVPCLTVDFEVVDELKETERGSGGFGSTGR